MLFERNQTSIRVEAKYYDSYAMGFFFLEKTPLSTDNSA